MNMNLKTMTGAELIERIEEALVELKARNMKGPELAQENPLKLEAISVRKPYKFQIPANLTRQHREILVDAIEQGLPVMISGPQMRTGKTALRNLLRVQGIDAREEWEFGRIALTEHDPTYGQESAPLVEHNGLLIRKVNRAMSAGDYVKFQDVKNGSALKNGEVYGPVKRTMTVGDEEYNVFNEHHNRTPDNVEVFEAVIHLGNLPQK